MTKNKIAGFIALTIGGIFVSCNNVPNSPGWEYMPDMYRSSSYETNSGNGIFADSMSNRKPASGTLSQGWLSNSDYSDLKMPYPYTNDTAGYEKAGRELNNPVAATPENVAIGKEKYDKFCSHCHGASGQGDGAVVMIGNFPGPSPYNSAALKNLPEGKMFHALQYGKNMMGSHASQLTIEERWTILRYVQTLQNPGGVSAQTPAAAPSDSTKKEISAVPSPVPAATNDTTATK